jgi:uncharacterized membrane-anchored protein YhcB (DUF1043 family)
VASLIAGIAGFIILNFLGKKAKKQKKILKS